MTWHSRAGRVAGAGVAALLLAVTGAVADVSGPDETPAQAYGPMQPGATYAGTFTSEGDVDHLSFKVDRAGETLHFTIANTDRDCPSPYPVECAVWGTLVDGAGQQLGGEGSSAGTGEVDPGARDTIDWTFAQPGTYYLAMDSGGKLPSYTVRYDERVAPVIGSLSVRSPQRGHVVTARATFGQPLRSLKARLVAYRRTSHGSVPIGFGSLTRTDVPAGTRTLKVALNRAGRQGLARAGRVRLRLRITATPQSGATVVQSRLLTLRR